MRKYVLVVKKMNSFDKSIKGAYSVINGYYSQSDEHLKSYEDAKQIYKTVFGKYPSTDDMETLSNFYDWVYSEMRRIDT